MRTTMKHVISNSFFRGYFRSLDLQGTKKWPDLSNGGRKVYEEILPGAADRIFLMAEKQALHRQQMEKKSFKKWRRAC